MPRSSLQSAESRSTDLDLTDATGHPRAQLSQVTAQRGERLASAWTRPRDDEYWIRPWSRVLFGGDLCLAIPFVDQPFETLVESDDDGKHFVGQIAFGYGLLISPTCDMLHQGTLGPAHPYRLFVPVLPLELVAEGANLSNDNVGLIRGQDKLHPYMYLPPLPPLFAESVACLYRPSLVDDESLRAAPRRIAQLGPEARRHLKIKLIRYFGRINPDRDGVDATERDEELFGADAEHPSPYDLDPARSPDDIPDW
jgi:hypothetical protein